MPSPHAGREQHERGVGEPGDLDLALPDADGLDEHDVAAGGVEHAQRLGRAPGQPAEVAARGHRPDVDAGSSAWSCIRTRSPSRAPPENGEDGSTASTPTRLPALRSSPTSAVVEVDLPTPGEPVMPTIWACPAYGARAAITSRSCGESSSTSEISRATARASPSRARATSSGRSGAASASRSLGEGRGRSGRRPDRRRRTARPRRCRRRAA